MFCGLSIIDVRLRGFLRLGNVEHPASVRVSLSRPVRRLSTKVSSGCRIAQQGTVGRCARGGAVVAIVVAVLAAAAVLAMAVLAMAHVAGRSGRGPGANGRATSYGRRVMSAAGQLKTSLIASESRALAH
ncbi:unnamed protein product [Lampetra fluviatilis]